MADEQEKEGQRLDTVKSLLTTNPFDRVKEWFPEYFQPDPEVMVQQAYDEQTGEYDIDKIDPAQIEWQTPTSPDEDDEISAWIEQQEKKNNGVVSFGANEWI